MVIKGRGVSEGIAIGTLTVYRSGVKTGESGEFTTAAKEISRFHLARLKVRAQLDDMKASAERERDEASVSLLSSYLVMVEDPEYIASVAGHIRDESKSAEDAVIIVRDSLNEMFSSMNDPYMQARGADIMDIGNRILMALTGRVSTMPVLQGNSILVSNDLSPSDTIELSRHNLIALVTKNGSYLSHMAILARGMGVPALVDVDFPSEYDGLQAIVDGYSGELIIDPSEDVLAEYRAKQARLAMDHESLEALLELPSNTTDGKHIGLLANVGSIDGVKHAIREGAEGVGLLRTEFLYLDSDAAPDEETQYRTYSEILKLLDGRRLVIRTLDVGADKVPKYLHMSSEPNPALGMRAVRYCLSHPNFFKTQLRAICRAAAEGPVSILLPMIVSLDEIHQVRDLLEEVRQELNKDRLPCGDYRLGVMIETPAAAMITDMIAREVDFLSIGTNDLAQYMLAVDRMNTKMDDYCDYRHEAIARMLRRIISDGHDNGCAVEICGEIASDVSYTKELLQMGADALSVVPSRLLSVKREIRDMKFL